MTMGEEEPALGGLGVSFRLGARASWEGLQEPPAALLLRRNGLYREMRLGDHVLQSCSQCLLGYSATLLLSAPIKELSVLGQGDCSVGKKSGRRQLSTGNCPLTSTRTAEP